MFTTDWNWFFSSIAQSAAAIVGIFGAFIVTKILANQWTFAEKSRRMQELISLGERLRDASNRLPFEWYHKYDSEQEIEDLKKLLEKDDSLSPDELYERLRLSPYIAKEDALQLIARVKSNREARLKREREEAQRRLEAARGTGNAFLAMQKLETLRDINAPLLTMGPQLSKARDEIDGMYTEVRHHSRIASDFVLLVAPNPESSKLVSASLLLVLMLFFAGVIYPLSFMPVPSVWKPTVSISAFPAVLFSLRGAMLTIVSVLFSTMLTMFFVLNLSLRYRAEDVARLQRYTQLATYSRFFANREATANFKRAT